MNQAAAVDWEALLMDLRRRGITLAAVSEQIGIPRTTLIDYQNRGMTPKHPDGEAIIKFWQGVTSSTREQLPQQQRVARFAR